MDNNISKIRNNIKDRNSEAWIKLCEYVEHIAKKRKKELLIILKLNFLI